MQEYQLYNVGIEDSILTMVQKLRNTVEELVFFQVSDESLLLFTDDNLKLLAHYAKEESKNLVLLTRNKELRQRAGKRLPTAESVESFLSQPDLEKEEPNKWAGLPRWAKNTIIVASVLFILLIVFQWGLRYWFSPKVVVTVYPKILTSEAELIIDLADLNVESQSIEIKKVSTKAASGKTIVGTHRATGEVVFFNQNPKEMKLYKGTQLKAKNGKIYQLTEDVLIPGAEVVYVMDVRSSQTAGQALGFIEAIELGETYNIKAGEISEFTGKYLDLTVRNLTDIAGGKSEARPTVMQADLDKAKQNVVDLLNKETVKANSEEYLVSGSLSRSEPAVIFDQKVGNFASTITANGSQKISFQKVSGLNIQEKAENILPNLLPSQYNLVESSCRINSADFSKDTVTVNVAFDLYPSLKSDEIIVAILGKSIEEAALVLNTIGNLSFDGVKDDLLPTRKEWIKVVVSEQYETEKSWITLSLNQSI
ncbi:MAG: hypothetical protein PHD88_05545 [Firmicutes bacterium]|nr:hypothetical protein [Bacillota bacterium]MDD4262976.1 hypothetical protein [Bacillota bacterium]MDD4693842.1 hypothetical protein [Bacillota bacterium]